MVYELRQLQHFVEIARHGNYARAAESLGLAQPTLTRSVQALERQVGGKLLDRGRAGAAPTALGMELLARAEHLLRQAQQVQQDMHQLSGLGAGSLRVGAGAYAAAISVGTAAARFARRHPAVTIDIAVADWRVLVPQLLEGQIDLAIAEATAAVEDDRLEVERLPRHRGVLFCRSAHPLLDRGAQLKPADLANYPFVSTSLPERIDRALESGLQRPQSGIRHRADTFDLIRHLVLESDAVAGAIPSMIAGDVAAGRVVVLPLRLPGLHSAYGIIRLARRTPSPATVAFTQALRDVEAEIAAGDEAAAAPEAG
jgi:DNA-binding transcriptional LysR family regulator